MHIRHVCVYMLLAIIINHNQTLIDAELYILAIKINNSCTINITKNGNVNWAVCKNYSNI